jgi:antitoxin VapB
MGKDKEGTGNVKRKDTPPKPKKSLLETLASMKPLKGKDRMPKIEDLPADGVDLWVEGLTESGNWHMLRHMSKQAAVPERRVKLFKNGRNQAVRIPREFELPGEDAVMRKEGKRLIIEPAPAMSLFDLLDSWEPMEEEIPLPVDNPPEPFDI